MIRLTLPAHRHWNDKGTNDNAQKREEDYSKWIGILSFGPMSTPISPKCSAAMTPILIEALSFAKSEGLPDHHVSPSQGQFLATLAQMIKARYVLEIGTLAGYSTISPGARHRFAGRGHQP